MRQSRRPVRPAHVAAVPLLAVLVGGLAACGGSSGGTASAHQQATGSPTPVTPTFPATPSASASPSGSAAALARCAPSQLTAATGSVNAATGHVRIVVTLTDTGDACSLEGYPGIGGIDSTGAPVTITATRGKDITFPAVAPQRVVLQHGGTASFDIGIHQIPEGGEDCVTLSRFEVTPPDATTSIALAADQGGQRVCGHTVAVSPVVAGPNGVGG